MGRLSQLLRRLTVLAVLAGLALGVLKRFGLIGGGECGPGCDCSTGVALCRCGHKTCLAPAPGA